MAAENPGRALAMAAGGDMFGMPTILDSSMLSGRDIINVNSSILGLPAATLEIAPVAFIGGAL
jgi:hypothetical protein